VEPSRNPQGSPANILAIRFARLGDVALVLPALGVLRAAFPDARLTVMTGTPYASLVRLCPHVDDVIAVDRHSMRDGSRLAAVRDIIALIGDVRSRRFDLVIDFHSFRETNLLAWLSGADCRLGMKRADRAYLGFCFNLEPVIEDKSLHVAEMFDLVVRGVPGVGAAQSVGGPSIEIPDRIREALGPQYSTPAPGSPIVAVYVGASVSSRRWPPERFAAVADHAVSSWGARVLILCGMSSEEESIGREIEAAVAQTGRVRLVSGLDVPHLAAAIGMADLLVSNDTGPMHLGPALGVPTLGIFSQSLPRHYRPSGPEDRYVKKTTVEEVTVGDVIGLMDQMRG
jgi:ADP-heptose:LPS heptosyltransferase